MINDNELRVNHEFVTAFETLRKLHSYREMLPGGTGDRYLV